MIATVPQPGVLHLVSAPGALDARRPMLGRTIPTYLCAQAIEQGLTPTGTVALIGDSTSQRFAHRLGLRVTHRMTPPMGHASMLARRVRQIAQQHARVICWNDELAPLLRGLQIPVDLISTNPSLARRRVPSRVGIRVFERSDRDRWEAKNHQAELESVLTPLIDSTPVLPESPTREELGIQHDALCVGVIADRPSDIDARGMGFLMGLLNVAGFELTAVLPENASHITAARRHHHALGSRYRFLLARDPMLTMLPVFDVLIHPCYDASGASSLIERLCENAETPVLRLNHSGREGLSRAPGVAGPVIEALDEILAERKPVTNRRSETPAHV